MEKLEVINKKEYQIELKKIIKRINEAKYRVALYSNEEKTLAYYDIGTYINEKKEWGNQYKKILADDLKDIDGFSQRNLEYMVRVADLYTKEEMAQQPVAQIPWGTLIEITYKCKSKESKLWYINKTYENSWSRSSLLKQIKAKAYERGRIEPIVSKGIKEYDNPLIKEIIKDSYYMPFSSKEINNEKDLKDLMMNKLIEVLQESGKGNAFVGREFKITSGKKTYYLDLLFYNYLLHAFVVVEVKIGEYKVEYLGQLKNYVMQVENNIKSDYDKKTIGILICKEADRTIVKYTIEDENIPLALSEYVLIDDLEKIRK